MVIGILTEVWNCADPVPAVPVTVTLYVPWAVPGSDFCTLPHPMTVTRTAAEARASIALNRRLRRGNGTSRTPARLAAPLPASRSGVPWNLLLIGCAGVVFTVSETVPVPEIEFGLTKHADSVRPEGIAQDKTMGEVKLAATLTATLAIAAEPTAAWVPEEESENVEIEIGTAAETDSA